MELEAPKKRRGETAQEAFKKLREKERIEMLYKMQKIEDAQERAIAAKAHKMKKEGKDNEPEKSPRKESTTFETKLMEYRKERILPVTEKSVGDSPQLKTSPARPIFATATPPKEPPPPMITKPEHADHADRTKIGGIETHQRQRKRRGRCKNCCGGLPGMGPGSAHSGGGRNCCCPYGNRMRGGSDTDRSNGENFRNIPSRSSSENSKSSRRFCDRHCGHSSKTSFLSMDVKSFHSGQDDQFDSFPIREDERERGGCGGCGAPPPSCCRPCPPLPPCQKPTQSRCIDTRRPSTVACCPCGGCGGAACSDNPGGGGIEGGCCGGSPPRGLPCKCKCQSCDTYHPLGGCGGQSCGKIYSCAGSSGGKCCFPRNTKRRSGTDCCGGGSGSNCGGCC